MVKKKATKGSPLFVGVDPGKSGAIAVYDGRKLIAVWMIPYLDSGQIDEKKLAKIFKALKLKGCVLAVIEKQQAFGNEGSVSSFTTGGGYMALRQAMTSAKIKYVIVGPNEWKRELDLPIARAKLPPLPKKPSNKKDRKAWKVELKKVTKLRGQLSRAKKKETKQIAMDRAQALQPGFDFRRTPRCKGPHDGKCESFLLAFIAYRRHTNAE